MDITKIKNYGELMKYMDENDIAYPYFCLDAREVPYSAVFTYDTFEEGTVPSCLETWEIMRAVNSTRANPVFSDQAVEYQKAASTKLNSLREEYKSQWIDTIFLNLVYDDKMPPLAAANYVEKLVGGLPKINLHIDHLFMWWNMKRNGASSSWLASTFEALLPQHEEKSPFCHCDYLEKAWDEMKESWGFSASESMAIISHLMSSNIDSTQWQRNLQIALENFQWTDYLKEYPPIPKDRVNKILFACPELLSYDSEDFLRYQIKPLIAAGFSDSQITDVFRAYKKSPFAMRNIKGAMESFTGLKLSAQDKYEILMYIANRFGDDQTSEGISEINSASPEMNGLNKLCGARDTKWLILFCLDHAGRDADGALTMAGKLANAGWGAGGISMYIKVLPKDMRSPLYDSVADIALEFERIGVPDADALYFLEEMFKRNLVIGFGGDMKNHAPAIVAGLRRRENLSYREALDRIIAEAAANHPPYTVEPLKAMRAKLE